MKSEVAENPNYQAVRLNAMKHGIIARYTVLPHEDKEEYERLLAQLEEEHRPDGPTELHLVEELAGVIWRKRRVLLAEGALINRGTLSVVRKEPLSFETSTIEAAAPLETRLSSKETALNDVVTATPKEVEAKQKRAENDLHATGKALTALLSNGGTRYQEAMDMLQKDSRGWFLERVSEEEYPTKAEGLMEFIYSQLLPLCQSVECNVRNYPEIKSQALGEGLQPSRLEKLSRYETHLDRKFERTLAMLHKMKEMR